jgi:hypothetical protein
MWKWWISVLRSCIVVGKERAKKSLKVHEKMHAGVKTFLLENEWWYWRKITFLIITTDAASGLRKKSREKRGGRESGIVEGRKIILSTFYGCFSRIYYV